MIQPRITAIEEAFATGYWNNVFIGVWYGTATVAATMEWSRQYQHMAARHPAGFLSLVIIEARAPIPDAAGRKALSAAMDDVGGALRAMAGVHETSGFVGATIRSVMLALVNMSRGPYLRRLFGSFDEAAQWLAPQSASTSARVGASQILEVVGEFRRLVGLARARERRAVSA